MLVESRIDAPLTIVGGGLAGGLIAFALSERRPDVRVSLIERRAALPPATR